ncbi:hemagglutinin repeat-containing protein [Polaromonas sp. LjRoot131]|uniref:hemagglutinin repeat-containing protein n=1 Tax=Polaromonas sp. LjRoot131 TaxID=3342262 RepID=UPI003ECF1D82
MNKNLYRIVFNAERGQLMAVAETATAQGKGADGERSSPLLRSVTTAVLNTGLTACAFAASALFAMAQAQIVADPGAPGSQRPTLQAAPNGVPLVNITAPSAAGVSRNNYTQFDVNPQGAILNNSRANVQTQLGGWVPANAALAGGSARVILNEVNSVNPSQLRGYVEVAGQRADVVISNPAGISVNGGGFINADRVTLTTGVPVINGANGGSLDSFRVQRGTVVVEGLGLDTRTASYTDILARAVQVNAGIWAQQLNVTTGANEVNAANPSVATPMAGTGAAPAFMLDIAALGGMYAGKIYLVGTEAGLGTRNAGAVRATGGDFVMQSNGWLSNQGVLQAAGNAQITTAGTVTNNATVYANGNTSINAQGGISNTGILAAQGNTTLQATGAGAQITSAAGSVLAAGLNPDGSLGATGDLNVTAQAAVVLKGQNVAGGNAGISASQIDLADAQVQSQNLSLAATAGNIDASRATVSATGTLTATTAQTLRTDSARVSAGRLNITAQDLSNIGGQITQTGTGNGSISASGSLNNTDGKIISNGSVTLSAPVLNNTRGQITAVHNANVTAATQLNNTDGRIAAGQHLAVAGGNISNLGTGRLEGNTASVTASQNLVNGSKIIATGQLDVAATGTLDNTGQIAGAQTTVQAATLNNQASGRIEGNALTVTANTVNNNGGGMVGDTVTVNATTLNNQGASALIAGTSKVKLYVSNTLNNTGGASIYSLGDMEIAASSSKDAYGTLLNRTTLVNNNTSLLQADGDMQIAAETLVNTRAAPQVTTTTSSSTKTLVKRNGYWMCEYGNYIDNFAGFCAAGYADLSWYDPTIHINPLAEKPGMFIGGWMVETERTTTTTVTDTQLQGVLQPEPKILVGNNLVLRNVGNLRNEYGSIMAGGNVTIGNADPLGSYQTASVTNTGAVLNRDTLVDEYSVFRWNRNFGAATTQSLAPQASTAVIGRVGGTMSAGGTFAIYAGSVLNTNALPGQSNASGAATPGPAGTAFILPSLASLSAAAGVVPGLPGALTIPPPRNPSQTYLIESDPRFTSYRQWLSSDYMLSALSYDPASLQKRLGDGFFEQKLIRDQVGQLTGRRFLDGYASEEAQYQALMASAITVAQQWKLRPGIALTAEQVANLTSDMVWLVEQDVMFTDGRTTKALVPVVYLSRVHTADLNPTGALISGKSVSITAKGDLTNNGALRAQDSILLAANKVTNKLGLIDASRGSTTVVSDTDIINRSGMISGNSVLLSAARDIQIDAVTRQFSASRQTVAGNVSGSNTEVGPQGSVVSRGDLVITAGRDIKLAGALVAAQGNASLNAGANLVVDTVQTQQSTQDVSVMGLRRTQGTTNLGSTLQTGGSLALSSGADTTLRAAQIGVGQDLSVISGGNLNIVAATDTTQLDENMRAKGYVRNDHTAQERVVGSNLLAGGNVTLAALQTAPDGSKGNITVQGSSVNAVTGQLNVVAANNVNIVEAREKGEFDLFNQTKSSGFLSSKSQTGHDTGNSNVAIGSSLSGNAVSISAGNNLTVRGSSVVGNGQTTLAAGNDVTIEAATSTATRNSFREEKKSGFSGSLMGGISYGKSAQDQNQNQQIVTQSGSTISGGNVVVVAGRDASINASAVLADRDVAVTAGRNINVLAATNIENTQNDSHSSSTSIGIAQGLGPRFTMFGKTSAVQDGSGSSTTSATSLLSANTGNLTLTAGTDAQYKNTGQGNLTTQGADLLAGDTIKLSANKVDLQAAANSSSSQFHAESKSLTIGSQLTGVIGSKITQIADLAQQARQGDNSRLQGAAALKAGYDAYKLASDPSALNVGGINASAKASADKVQPGGPSDPANSAFGVSVSLGTSSSSQDSRQSRTEQRGTNLQAQNIDIKATESDINMVGAKLQAQNIALDAAKDVKLIAAQNTAEIQSKNNSSSAGIGVTFGFGEQSGISFQIGASNGKGRADGSETTYDNTQISATNKLSVKSGNDTSLIGAQLAGKTVEMDVGGKLNIETLQDSSSYESKQTTGGFGLSLCIPPFCYGTTVSGNLSASKQQVDHNYLSAVGQSGIAAGTGGFDIKVAGATDLKGAAITSEADKSKNTLSTSSLTYSDLQNRQDTSASSESASVSFSSGASMASNLASNLTNNLLANAMGNTGLPESGSQSGVTQSVISPAQVTITGGDKQSEENVATLTSRDASTANGALKNTLTLQQAQELQAQQQKAKENAQAAQYIGAVITNAIGDLAEKNEWLEGSWQKTVLHGMAGVIQAKVAGTSALSGAVAGALNEQLIPLMEVYLLEQGYVKGSADFNALMTAGSTLAGAAIGAASIANTATVNNYLKHDQWASYSKERAACVSDDCRRKIDEKYAQLSASQDNLLATCDIRGDCEKLIKELNAGTAARDALIQQGKLPEAFVAAVNLQWQAQQLAVNPTLRAAATQSIIAEVLCKTNPSGCTKQAAIVTAGLLAMVVGGPMVPAVLEAMPAIASSLGVSVSTCVANWRVCATQVTLATGDMAAADALGGSSVVGSAWAGSRLAALAAEEAAALKAGKQDVAYVLHQIELGIDPAKGKYIVDEAITGIRLEGVLGARLERDLSGNGDWRAKSGVLYDAASPPPTAFFNDASFSSWKSSMQRHFLKEGVVVVDVVQRGLTQQQVALVLDYVKALPSSQQSRVLVLR